MSELLDTMVLDELREIMEDEFPSLLKTFLTESERQFQEVCAAKEAGDYDQLRRAAHALKGSCGNVGALDLHQTCADLEHQANDAVVEGLDALIAATGEQLADVCQAVQELC